MRCGFCDDGEMRLIRFENGREIWRCRSCLKESQRLDCALCEFRAVRQLTSSPGVNRWGCSRCHVEQFRCPRCRGGWVRNLSGDGWRCEHCQHVWATAGAIA